MEVVVDLARAPILAAAPEVPMETKLGNPME
jgi:hypothetical protein